MMSDNEIIKLVKDHFLEEEIDDDGYCWIEYAGKPDAFLKFARQIFQEGYNSGHTDGYYSWDSDEEFNE